MKHHVPLASAYTTEYPADASAVATLHAATVGDVDEAVQAAQAARLKPDWAGLKVNERAAIERDAVRRAFAKAGVRVFVGDWTNGDPAITRFIEAQGRAGVPLYLWYEPGKPPEQLPQLLSAAMLTERAQRVR